MIYLLITIVLIFYMDALKNIIINHNYIQNYF